MPGNEHRDELLRRHSTAERDEHPAEPPQSVESAGRKPVGVVAWDCCRDMEGRGETDARLVKRRDRRSNARVRGRSGDPDGRSRTADAHGLDDEDVDGTDSEQLGCCCRILHGLVGRDRHVHRSSNAGERRGAEGGIDWLLDVLEIEVGQPAQDADCLLLGQVAVQVKPDSNIRTVVAAGEPRRLNLLLRGTARLPLLFAVLCAVGIGVGGRP